MTRSQLSWGVSPLPAPAQGGPHRLLFLHMRLAVENEALVVRAAHVRKFRTLIRASGELSGDALAVLEHHLPPGTLAMPRHRHAAAEAITVTYGELTVEIGREVRVLRAGDSIAIPPAVSHTFWVAVDATRPATFVAVVAPAGLEGYYADVARAVVDGGQPDMAAIHAAGTRHGVEVDMDSLFELIERHTLQLS